MIAMIDTVSHKSSFNHQVLIFLPSKVIDTMDIIAATFELIRIIGRFPKIFIPPNCEHIKTTNTFKIFIETKEIMFARSIILVECFVKVSHKAIMFATNTGITIY